MAQTLFRPRPSWLLAAVVALTACTDSTGPGGPVTGEFTVNDSLTFAYLKLGTPADTVTVADPTASAAWDIALFATTVTLNGGAAGPGGVSGYCVCEHASATTTELQAFAADPTKQRAVFDSVTVADIPANIAFQSDQLDPAINGWYTGPYGSGTITPNRAWIFRVGGATTLLGKLQVLAVVGATDSTPGKLKFQFAIESGAGQEFGADKTDSVDLTSGSPAYFKFTTAGAGTSSDWEVKFDHWNIRLNGGVSGPGAVGAVVDAQTPYGSIVYTNYAQFIPPQAFRPDEFSGVFGDQPWYRYNITGTDNQIWPTFSVYLIKRGSTVFKVQLVGYYAANGASRHVTVRYAKLQG